MIPLSKPRAVFHIDVSGDDVGSADIPGGEWRDQTPTGANYSCGYMCLLVD